MMSQQPGADTAAKRRASSLDEHRAPRRDAIVRAALEAIEENGPDALTGQIAERAGLARTHVYRHFGSKDELDQAVARAARAELTGRIRATLGAEGTPDELLRAPIGAMLGWAEAHPNVYRFLLKRSAGSSGRLPPQGALAADVIALAGRYLRSIVSDDIASQSDIDAAMTGVIGLVDARVLWWLDHPGVSRESLADDLTDSAWVLLDHYTRRVGIRLHRHDTIAFPG